MLAFTVKYFPGEPGNWRVTIDDNIAHDAVYWVADSMDDLPRCIRGLLRHQADYIAALAQEPKK